MILVSFIFFLYTLFILSLTYGNFSFTKALIEKKIIRNVSVVIAFRNEEENLKKLVESLMRQNYSLEHFELVFVNDHSEDGGKKLLNSLLANFKGKFQILDLLIGAGKKAALDFGIKNSEGEIILTTDADCVLQPEWLTTMVNYLETDESSFVAGPVALASNDSILEELMQLEFAALIASTSGGFGIKMPFMCNGANLGFSKSTYESINPYDSNLKLASGDDVFFLHQVKERGQNVSFVASQKALVITNSASSVKQFLKQRIRWAGKSVAYKDMHILMAGFIVTAVNLALLFCFYQFLINEVNLAVFLGLFLLKVVLDSALVYSAKKWVVAKNVILNSLLLSFIYPFYSVGIALLSLGFKPKWKGRNI